MGEQERREAEGGGGGGEAAAANTSGMQVRRGQTQLSRLLF